MAELSASATIEGTVEQVWALIGDFGHIENWWPKGGPVEIERVDIEGDGVGMIRHIFNRGVQQCVSERLDLLDPQSHTLILSIVGRRPGGITAYVATSRLTALGPHACSIEHRAHVTTEAGREKAVERFLYQAYALMFEGLNSALKKSA